MNWDREQHATDQAVARVEDLLRAVTDHVNTGRRVTAYSDPWAEGRLTPDTAREWHDYAESGEQLWEQVIAFASARWLEWRGRRVDASAVLRAVTESEQPGGGPPLRLVKNERNERNH